jgi:hypothetical protein
MESIIQLPKSKGIVAQLNKAKLKVSIGKIIKRNLLESIGIKVSLDKSLQPSAKACKKP